MINNDLAYYSTVCKKMQEEKWRRVGEHCVLSGPSFKNKNPEDKSSDFNFWRRVGDSNSRSRFPQTNDLANRPLQPLG